jgi:ferrous iron transport protein A
LTEVIQKDKISTTLLKGDMRLLETPIGKTVRIVEYKGGKGVGHKLRQLGLTPGKEVSVLRQAPMGGPMMIDIEGRSIALGRGIAARVQVEIDY